MWFLYPDIGFCRGRKTGKPIEKPFEDGKDQQQTQTTSGNRLESNPGKI